MQLGSTNLTYTWTTGLFWGQKVKVTRHKNVAGVGHGAVVSAGFF